MRAHLYAYLPPPEINHFTHLTPPYSPLMHLTPPTPPLLPPTPPCSSLTPLQKRGSNGTYITTVDIESRAATRFKLKFVAVQKGISQCWISFS